MAEKEGFEPSRQSTHPTPLAGEPLRPLGYFSIFIWRRERDSTPRCLSTSLVFKTSAFNRSAISPRCGTSEKYYNSFRPARQSSFFKKYGFSEILSLNGGKRKQEPHEMRPCLKRQPSKAQGFSAAAVLEEIHRAKQKFFFLPISHHPPRAPGRRLGALQSKAPGCACLSAVCLIAVPMISLRRKGKNIRFFGISSRRKAGSRKPFPEI